MGKRIGWVDVFKAIAIIFVVVGHSSMGQIGAIIYQFHMAAFFLISGYTFNVSKKSTLKNLYDKIWGLLIPLFTIFFFLLGVVNILDYFGVYELLFPDPLVKASIIIKIFFKSGNNFIFWMGAGWFIIVLLGIFILHKLIFLISQKKISWIYFIISLALNIIGYKMAHEKVQFNLWIFNLDLIFIGQFYFAIGIFLRKYNLFERAFSNHFVSLITFVGTLFVFYIFLKFVPATVNYPTRDFNKIHIDFLASLNGILFCFFISKYLDIFLGKFKRILTYIGENTYCIVLFHFMFFNVAYYILYLFDIVKIEYLKSFTPSLEIGVAYGWFIIFISISLSLLLWELIGRIPIVSTLIGVDARFRNKLWGNISKNSLIVKLEKWELGNEE